MFYSIILNQNYPIHPENTLDSVPSTLEDNRPVSIFNSSPRKTEAIEQIPLVHRPRSIYNEQKELNKPSPTPPMKP